MLLTLGKIVINKNGIERGCSTHYRGGKSTQAFVWNTYREQASLTD